MCARALSHGQVRVCVMSVRQRVNVRVSVHMRKLRACACACASERGNAHVSAARRAWCASVMAAVPASISHDSYTRRPRESIGLAGDACIYAYARIHMPMRAYAHMHGYIQTTRSADTKTRPHMRASSPEIALLSIRTHAHTRAHTRVYAPM